MGRLEKWREWPGNGTPRSIILVPGVSASTLEQQTCTHFPKFIELCYAKPDTPHTVWVFNHGVTPRTRECWDTFIAAGEQLLTEILSVIEREDDVELVLIGHRLGVFLLKKALVLAHRRNHHPGPKVLFEALQKIIMIGDPYLHEENRQDWAWLVKECLDCPKKLSQDMFSGDALDALKHISSMFDNVTVQSQFFQVTGKASQRRRLLILKANSTYKSCLCDANIGVRMWTTADEEEIVPLCEGDTNVCVFHQGSNCHEPLLRITGRDYEADSDRLLTSTADSATNLPQPTITSNSGTRMVSITCSKIAVCEEDGSNLRSTQCHQTEGNALLDQTATSRQSFPQTSGSVTLVSDSDSNSSCRNTGSITVHKDSLGDTKLPGKSQSSMDQLSNEQSDVENCPAREKPDPDENAEPIPEITDPIPTAMRQRPLPLQLHIPPPCQHFVNREPLLETLRWFLLTKAATSSDEAVAPKQMLAILHGMAGIGKTQIAREFAIQHQKEFDTVFWIRSDSQASIARSLHDAAIALCLINGRKDFCHDQSSVASLNWFKNTNSKWLLIFDNADDYDVLRAYIPQNVSGAILITTRNGVKEHFDPIGNAATVLDLEVPPFTPDEGHELFRKYFSDQGKTPSAEQASSLVDLLGGHPLALAQAAAFINEANVSIPHYINDFERHSQELSNVSDSGLELESTALRLISQPTPMRSLSTQARDLCSVLACLDPDDMDESLLLAASVCELPLKNFPKTRVEIRRCISETRSYGYTQPLSESRLAWHCAAVQDAYQLSMPPQQQRNALKTTSILLLSSWPSVKKIKNVLRGYWPEFDHLHTHVRRLSQVWVSSAQDPGVFNNLSRDDTFIQLLTQSCWYNSNIRGNGGEDVNLQELAYTLYDYRGRKSSNLLSVAKIPSYLPSRLLHIDHNHKQCRLINTDGTQLDYMATSYVWSSDLAIPKLTKSTEAQLQGGISFAEIPLINIASSFMEQADIHYLWVDRLCIIQDNPDDLRSELNSMADTYSSSKAVLAYAPTQPASTQSRWSSRAWTCQEVLLSPRRLVIGQYTIRGHGSDKFCQSWFSKIATSSLRAHLTRTSGTSIAPCTLCQHRLQNDSHFHSPGNVGSFRFEDLGEELRESLPSGGRESRQNTNTIKDTGRLPNTEISTTELSGEKTSGSNSAITDPRRSEDTEAAEADALRLIEEGVSHYGSKGALQAVGRFFRAREYVSVAAFSSSTALQAHMLASTYLAIIYIDDGALDEAFDMLSASKKRMAEHLTFDNHLSVVSVRFILTDANVHAALGHEEEAIKLYQKAIAGSKNNPEAADFAALAKLKLCRLKLSSDTNEAHALVKESLTHFEVQETTSGQTQYSRALYYRALVFGAEGKEKLKNRTMMDARRSLEAVCEERGLPEPPDRELVLEDFEGVLDFGLI